MLLPPAQIIRIKFKAILKPALATYALTLGAALVQLSTVSSSDAPNVSFYWLQTILIHSIITLSCIFFGLYFGSSFALAGAQLNKPLYSSNKSSRSLLNGAATAVILGLALGTTITLATRLANGEAPPIEGKQLEHTLGGTSFLVLASSAIIEEVWFRLGLMTFIVWAVHRLFDHKLAVRGMVWTIILFSSVSFGVSHIPDLLNHGHDSNLELWGSVVGESLGVALSSWCFWKKGLPAAIAAHLSIDLVPFLFQQF